MEIGSGHEASWDSNRAALSRPFLRDMERLWGNILRMAAVVESTLNTSIRALCDGNMDLASEVRSGESGINLLDIQIESECLKILALHQPVASDLRRVTAILKIDRDLERMADLADHISKRARKLAAKPNPVPIPASVEALAMESLGQVHNSLDALVKADTTMARSVIVADRTIDRMRAALIKELKTAIRSDPERVSSYLRLINTARNLERIADHATNIAESVIYMKEGDIVRRVTSNSRRRSTI